MSTDYLNPGPGADEIAALPGATLLEFGTGWCGHCRRAQALVEQALQARPGLRHLKVEDGSGRPLGRAFGVQLWPTLVFLQDGREVARLVRPTAQAPIDEALATLV